MTAKPCFLYDLLSVRKVALFEEPAARLKDRVTFRLMRHWLRMTDSNKLR